MSHIKSLVVTIVFIAAGSLQTHAQGPPRFEVASVRLNSSGLPNGTFSGTDRSRFSARNVTAKMLLAMAYQVRDFQILGGPAWLSSDRFDIAAKAETDVEWDRMMLLLQKLLQDRFSLVTHRETRQLPVYALTAAKGGLKLHAGNCGDSDGEIACGRIGIYKNSLQGQTSMPLFINVLSDMLGRPVVDETKFTGPFDVRLKWSPDDSTAGNRSGDSLPSTDGADPTFFTAMEEQLGLRLESRKGPVETITIEHAEKPTEN